MDSSRKNNVLKMLSVGVVISILVQHILGATGWVIPFSVRKADPAYGFLYSSHALVVVVVLAVLMVLWKKNYAIAAGLLLGILLWLPYLMLLMAISGTWL